MKYLFFSFLSISLLSCSNEPAAIQYGFDQCNFCEMTIVDQSHAAVLVSKKGKTFKFDAIECMSRYLNRNENTEYSQLLVTDYLEPGVLISTESACFLISPEIPSPMGANLTAFGNRNECLIQKNENGGDLFSWDEIVSRFK